MERRANETAAFGVSTGRLSPESAKKLSSLQPAGCQLAISGRNEGAL